MRLIHGAQYDVIYRRLTRSYRDRKDIALQSAQFLKSRNPHSVVKVKDLHTGEEVIIAFKSGQQ